jgi:hypothetical protein
LLAACQSKTACLDVKVVLDWKANTGKKNQASQTAMNLLVNAGIPGSHSAAVQNHARQSDHC